MAWRQPFCSPLDTETRAPAWPTCCGVLLLAVHRDSGYTPRPLRPTLLPVLQMVAHCRQAQTSSGLAKLMNFSALRWAGPHLLQQGLSSFQVGPCLGTPPQPSGSICCFLITYSYSFVLVDNYVTPPTFNLLCGVYLLTGPRLLQDENNLTQRKILSC